MSVISKVDEKVQNIISLLPENYSEEDFLEKFIATYPADYKKCWNKFMEEERLTKPGKSHPMQHPNKHIINALKSYLSRKSKNKNYEK